MLNIEELIKNSLKKQDKSALKIYRLIKAEKLNLITAKNAKPYNEEAEIKMLQKMIKQREEAFEIYKNAKREDLTSELEDELNILRTLVPAVPSREEIDNFTSELISSLNEEFKMGEIIKMVKSKFPTADGKMISEIVKSYM